MPADATLHDLIEDCTSSITRRVTGGVGRFVVLERDRLVGLITANGILHLTQTRSSLGG